MMHLPNGWYVCFESKEITHKPLGAKRFGLSLVAYRDEQGNAIVLEDVCPHRTAKLSAGRVLGSEIECPFHGWRFDGSGTCTLIPEIQKGAPGVKVRSFPVFEKNHWVFVWWGIANPTKEPEWFSDLPLDYHVSSAKYLWECAYQRCVENQLDYNHLSFVHRKTIGRYSDPTVHPELVDDGVRLKWFFPKQEGYIEFLFPNYWQIRLSTNYSGSLAFIPVEENKTELNLRSHRSFGKWPPLSWLIGSVDRILNRRILNEDKRVVSTQLAPSKVTTEERLMKSDEPIRAFRKWLDSAG